MFSRGACPALVPTLCVGTPAPTLCVVVRRHVALASLSRRRASQRAFPRRAWERGRSSFSFSQKRLDRIVNRVLAVDFGEGQVLPRILDAAQLADVFARAVGAFDLAIAEQVAVWQDVLRQELDARFIVLPPVVSIRKLEAVDVPVGRGEILQDDVASDLVGRGNPRPAALA